MTTSIASFQLISGLLFLSKPKTKDRQAYSVYGLILRTRQDTIMTGAVKTDLHVA